MSSTTPERFLGTLMYERKYSGKQETLCRDAIDYAVNNYNGYRRRQIKKMTLLADAYNGITDARNFEYLNRTYGKENLANYIDYRLARPKIDGLVGEFLSRELSGTAYTINKAAKSRKLQNYQFLLGRWVAQEALEQQKQMVGYDVFEGMPMPKVKPADGPQQATVRPNFNVKETNEIIMQVLIKNFIKKQRYGQDTKTRFASCYRDVLIMAECYGKVYIDKNGNVVFREIDPRNGIWEEIERDPFLGDSPYSGEARLMFIHDILSEYELTDDQKKNLYEIRDRWDQNVNTSNEQWRMNYRLVEKNLAVMVYTIEWYVIKPFYTKVVPDPRNPDAEPYRKSLSIDYYNQNFDQIQRDIEIGKYTIETKYKKIIWEATRIGADMYVNMREKPNIIGSIDNPFNTMYSYTGLLMNTLDGIRISVQESLENVSRIYNIIMFQINRELSKAKGKVVTYDRAYLPKGKTMKDVMHKLTNDGIYDFDSSADGNMSGTTMEVQGSIREIDLGISSNMQVLLTLKVQLQDMADRLSGLSNERQGEIAASQTSGNAQLAVQGSRNITEPLNYYFDRYVENILLRVAEYSKITVFTHPDKMGMIIGDDAVGFLKITKDISYDDYGWYLADSRKEEEIKNRIRGLMEFALNSKEMRVQDALDFELSETMAEAVAVVKQGWQQVQQMAQQSQQQQQQAQGQQQQAAQEGQAALAEQQFQQKQALEKQRGLNKVAAETVKGRNQYVLNSQQAINDVLSAGDGGNSGLSQGGAQSPPPNGPPYPDQPV
jgi:hypothetical protein